MSEEPTPTVKFVFPEFPSLNKRPPKEKDRMEMATLMMVESMRKARILFSFIGVGLIGCYSRQWCLKIVKKKISPNFSFW